MRKPHAHDDRGRPGPPRHGRRPLAHGDLGLLILSLVSKTPRHGYDLMTEIETRSGGSYKPSPGVIYPALEVLQDKDLVQMIPDGTKKSYQITTAGNTLLAESADIIDQINGRIAALASPAGMDDANDLPAAMRRLHHSVRSHMRHSDMSEEQKIIAILDETRQKVEALSSS